MSPPAPAPPPRPRPGSPRASRTGWPTARRTARPRRSRPDSRRPSGAATRSAGLPTDEDFGFAGDPERLARAYEGGWAACALIADHWGEEKLSAFYRAVGGHAGRDGAVRQAMREVLGTTPAEFTALWREWLRSRLG